MMTPPTARRLTPLLGAVPLVLALAVSPVRAQPEDLDAWRVVVSPHFVIHTNAAAERGAEIAVSLELFRSVFARLAPALELRSPAPTKILAFRDAAAYAPYKTRPDREGARVLGQFLSHPDGNYLTLDAGTRLVGSFAVIYHEYVHHFVRHNFPGMPRWLNEGLAEYYSTFAVAGETVHVGRPVERHVRWLAQHGDFALSDVLAAEGRSAPSHQGSQAGRYYAVSWALVHYLLSGGHERADQIADLLLALDYGEDPFDAFEEAFDTRASRLEEQLLAYVAAGEYPQASFKVADLDAATAVRSAPAAAPDVLFHLGDLLVHMGRRQEAERHFQRALDLDPDHPEAHAGLALVRDLGGRFEEAEVLYRDAAASADPLTHVLYGRHLLRRLRRGAAATGDPAAKARAVLARAIDLDAGYAEAHYLFGLTYLFGDVEAAPGIAALEKAHAWLPQRHDVTLHLLDLYLKDRAFDRAERLLAVALAGRADDQRVHEAREKIERERLLHQASSALEDGDVQRAVELFDEAISVTSDPRLRERLEAQLRALQKRHGGR